MRYYQARILNHIQLNPLQRGFKMATQSMSEHNSILLMVLKVLVARYIDILS